MNNKKKILIAILGVLSVILIGTGATVAFFVYGQSGTTESEVRAGTMEFHYDEVSKKGNGISLIDALPADSNDAEKIKNNYFEFNVTAKSANQPLSYVVTAKKSSESDNIDDIIDLYLTDDTDTELFGGIHRYNNYVQYRNKAATEKVIYTGTVPANSSNYDQEFRLRMWIDDSIDFSGREVTKYFCSGTEVELNSTEYTNCDPANLTQTTDMVYDYNGKTFKITINVYTDTDITGYDLSGGTTPSPTPTPTATPEPYDPTKDTTLSSLVVNGCTFTQPFDSNTKEYVCTDLTGTTTPTYTATTTNTNATIGYPSGLGQVGDVKQEVPNEPYTYYRTLQIPVTAEDGTTWDQYFVHYGKYTDYYDATKLSSLSVTDCPITTTGAAAINYDDKPFTPGVLNYKCTSSRKITTSDFTYVTQDSNATATLNLRGSSAATDPNYVVSVYDIVVTYNTTNTRTYTVNVTEPVAD